ncbi:MAG: hypothetical protein HY908_34010 [Myxococcales bacterium]|nr:hypothetical protein [Myxococcales bacterium]
MTTESTAETLRDELERRRALGKRFTLKEVVKLVVPLCADLAAHHKILGKLAVHPGCVVYSPEGLRFDEGASHEPPIQARDRACLPPEERHGKPGGDKSASVFSIGAILYEMITGQSVGPGMRRPSDIVKGLPESFEVLLSKALVTDPTHRPSDLEALAQALHHASPSASIPPPPADESHLDAEGGVEVDVSLSMIPPAPGGAGKPHAAPKQQFSQVASAGIMAFAATDSPASSRGGAAATSVPGSTARNSTERLAELKAALESDPRPRYVVIKDSIDHGPFTAVELLQQIATGNFRGDLYLRDTLSLDERLIDDWEQFAPFAQQARLGKEAKERKRELEATVHKEKSGTRAKALIGGGVILLVLAAGVGWWMRARASGENKAQVQGQVAVVSDIDGGFRTGEVGDNSLASEGSGGPKFSYKKAGDGDGPTPSGGSYPAARGGSCAAAQASYVEDYTKRNVPPDLTAGAFQSVLGRGTYLNACGVPPTTTVTVCAAVQNGIAVGVTVSTSPVDGALNSCIRSAVQGLAYPSHPRLDVTTTVFK